MWRGTRNAGEFFLRRVPPIAACKWGKSFPRSQRILVFFLVPRDEPRRRGKPGEVDSHDYYAWESTRPYWDLV